MIFAGLAFRAFTSSRWGRCSRIGGVLAPWTALLAAFAVSSGGAATAGAATATGYATSRDWSGYIAQGRRGFDQVSGGWRVPSATCATASAETFSAAWVGLGGWNGRQQIEQIGTDTNCIPPSSGLASVAYANAWWEIYPAPRQLLDRSPAPGDYVEAAVTVRGHEVTLRLVDETAHWSFVHRTRVVSAALSSAEWIIEDPTTACDIGSCPLEPFASFSPVTISHAHARSTLGRSGSISARAWFALRVALIQGTPRVLLSWPSALKAAGTAFTVSRVHRRPPPEPSPPV